MEKLLNEGKFDLSSLVVSEGDPNPQEEEEEDTEQEEM